MDNNYSERGYRDDRSFRDQSFREHRQPTSRSYGNSYLNTDSSMTAEARLNPRYTFDNFVIGDSNRFCDGDVARGGRIARYHVQPAVSLLGLGNG